MTDFLRDDFPRLSKDFLDDFACVRKLGGEGGGDGGGDGDD